SPPSIELYILDFDRLIYGETVRVEFLRRLRDVRPFDSAEALIRQMRRDERSARAWFASQRPPGD
ncbi:MAG: riboflavin kinase, partial [Gemmatimonadota bacterium]